MADNGKDKTYISMRLSVPLISIYLATTTSIFLPSGTQASEVASDKSGWLKASLDELKNPILPKVSSPQLTGEIHTSVRAQESPYLDAPPLPRRSSFATAPGGKSQFSSQPIARHASRSMANHNSGEKFAVKDNLCVKCRTEEVAQTQTYAKKPDLSSYIDLVEQSCQPNQPIQKDTGEYSGTPISGPSMQIDNQSPIVRNAFPTRLPCDSPRLSDTDPDTNFADIVIPGDTNPSKIGPPPFPLSLLPEHQLKQLIRSSCARNTTRTSPASFGSWHGANRSLPLAGFHSYIPSRNQITACYAPYNSRKASASIRHVNHSASATESFQPLRKASTNQLKVAAYPVYHSTLQASSY